MLLTMSGVSISHASGGFYLGPSAGFMDADVSGFDEATNAGFLLGYDFFSKELFHVSAETEFTTTVSDGDLEAAGQKGDWDIDTRAFYLAARVGESVYIKVRFGAAWSDVSGRVAGISVSN